MWCAAPRPRNTTKPGSGACGGRLRVRADLVGGRGRIDDGPAEAVDRLDGDLVGVELEVGGDGHPDRCGLDEQRRGPIPERNALARTADGGQVRILVHRIAVEPARLANRDGRLPEVLAVL